eukprot:3099391-Rhodomonas_salina.4
MPCPAQGMGMLSLEEAAAFTKASDQKDPRTTRVMEEHMGTLEQTAQAIRQMSSSAIEYDSVEPRTMARFLQSSLNTLLRNPSASGKRGHRTKPSREALRNVPLDPTMARLVTDRRFRAER